MPIPNPTLGGLQLWADVRLAGGYKVQRNVLTGHLRLLSPADLRLISGSLRRCEARLERERPALPATGPHLVLGLHGIFRSRHALTPMMRGLRAAGLRAWALNYPSTRQSLERSADDLEDLIEHLEGVERLSFVAHSMGGLLVRELLARDAPWRQRIALGGLVTVASPHQGAELADLLRDSELFHLIAGPSGQQLTTDRAPLLPLPPLPVLTVAGVQGRPSGLNPRIAGDDDMTVGAWSTHLPGEAAHLEVRAVHTFVQSHPEVVRAAARFLTSLPATG
ncbi:MAG: alpha/beta fold hydrolase [Deltaproteobacteria bacterium]|nr:alpha/beta fold hydrolase [Deltaproteobacteria bacterium]